MLDMLPGGIEVEHKAVAFDTMKALARRLLAAGACPATVTPVMLLWIRGVRFMYSVDSYLPPGTKPRWRTLFQAARRGCPGCRSCFGSWGTTTSRFSPVPAGQAEATVDYHNGLLVTIVNGRVSCQEPAGPVIRRSQDTAASQRCGVYERYWEDWALTSR